MFKASTSTVAKELLKLEDLAVVIQLFLDGPTFAICEQMRAEDKKEEDNLTGEIAKKPF